MNHAVNDHMTLKRAHRVHLFQLEIRPKKRDILSEKRDGAKKKREFTPESGTVDTYAMSMCHMYIVSTTLVYICHIDYDQY